MNKYNTFDGTINEFIMQTITTANAAGRPTNTLAPTTTRDSNTHIAALVSGAWRLITNATGAPYTDVWYFLEEEDPSNPTLWSQDFRDADESTAKAFWNKDIWANTIRSFRVYSATELAGDRQSKLLFDAWIDSLDSATSFAKIRKDQTLLRINYGMVQRGVDPSSTGGMLAIDLMASNLGFSQFVEEKSGGVAVSLLTLTTAAGGFGPVVALSQAQKKAVAAALLNARTGINTTKPPETQDELLDIAQCALMSDLFNKGWSYNNYPTTWSNGTMATGDAHNKCFNGRIYPVTVDGFDPNKLINYCTTPQSTQFFFADRQRESSNLWWGLSWVYKDAEGLKDTKIYLDSDGANNDYSPIKQLVKDGLLTGGQYSSWNAIKKRNGYVFQEISIDFDGTNPSTARNDVKVTMRIELDHLSSIDTVCAYAKVVSKSAVFGGSGLLRAASRGGTAEIKIHDLITVTQSPIVNVTTPSGGGYLKNTYTPEASRLRLKVWFDEQLGKKTESALIVDLTMIDHEIARSDDESNKTILTINYRGYFEEALNAPYNDALATEAVIKNRVAREEAVSESYKDGCSTQSIRELKRAIDQTNISETEELQENGGIPGRLFTSQRLYKYEIDKPTYDLGRIGTRLDPVYNYVKAGSISKVYPTGIPILNTPSGSSGTPTLKEQLDQYSKETGKLITAGGATYKTVTRTTNYFFYLGDLMHMVTDTLYQANSAAHHPHVEDLNMRFIVGTFRVPDPQNISKTITINPLQIPIDYGYFIKWYSDTIVKKGVMNYAIGPFIKDLIERLVNDILFDNCFSLLNIDENPPLLRSTFFADHSDTWFKSKQYITANSQLADWFDPSDPFATNSTLPENIMIKKDIYSSVDSSKNYCIIYQQFPSFFRQLRNGSNPLSADKSTITLYDGFNNKSANYASKTSFAKANSNSYLREARYFNNNFGSLALLANVYDLTFSLHTNKMNTYMYPGNIMNFIVTDFAGNTWKPGDNLGESDPHILNTKANVLGYGGYYIITKVSYKLSIEQSIGSSFIDITAKFLGTDANLPVTKDFAASAFIDDPKECADAYNAQVDELRVIDTEAANQFEFGVSAGGTAGPSNQLPVIPQTNTGTRVTNNGATITTSSTASLPANQARVSGTLTLGNANLSLNNAGVTHLGQFLLSLVPNATVGSKSFTLTKSDGSTKTIALKIINITGTGGSKKANVSYTIGGKTYTNTNVTIY